MKVQRTDIAVLVASLLWGVNFSTVKIALFYVSPLVMGMLRFVIAAIVMMILLKCVEGNVRVSWRFLWRLILAAVVGFGMQQLCFLFGARFVDASLTSLLTAFTTGIMTVVASVIARERLTRVMLGGVLLACGGMSLVVLGKGSAFMLDAKSWVGIILVFAAGIIAGFTPIINKEALAHYSASKVTTWTIVFGAFFFLPLGVSDSSVTVVPQLPAWVWFAIVFTSLGATAFANIFWNYGIAHIGVVRMTIYGYLPPIIGILLSTVIMHESLTLIQWGGTLLTLGGVVVSQFDKIKFRRPRPVRAPQQIERVREYVEMVSTGKHQAVGKIAAH